MEARLIGYFQRVALRNLLSPYGLATISLVLFVLAWVAPPSLFINYVGEPDYLFLNAAALFFYLSCVLLFLAGVRVFEYLMPGPNVPPSLVSRSPLPFLLVPLSISTALCIVSVVVLNGNVSNLAGLFLSQEGALIKLANASGQAEEGSWGYVLTFHTGMLWWAYSRSKQLVQQGASTSLFRVGFMIALLVGVVTALIKVDRTNLIPIITGILIVYLFAKLSDRRVRVRKVIAISFVIALIILAAFVGVSYVRGASDPGIVVAGVFGYTATSYNRLAAEVIGLMHYSFGGRGIYLSGFLSFNNTINRIVPFNALMGSPTERGVYLSEFSDIAAGGLNPGYNWSGAFGYLFADLGWWTPLYLLPVGIFNGYLWRQFRKQSIVGVVLYPWAAFSILFWFGWNTLFDLRFALLAVVVAVMAVYEHFLLGRRAAIAPDAAAPVESPAGSLSDSVSLPAEWA